ncbi:cytochrome P450 [Streptomyces sp. NPDC088752]|uniref:cytochrome P450 n=1 Tax=Streptomyces sp. NPDC088752 TaxID=3154963 RepID=UPI00342C75CC
MTAVSAPPDHTVVILGSQWADESIGRFIAPEWDVRKAGLPWSSEATLLEGVYEYLSAPGAPTRAVLLGYGEFGTAAIEFADAHPERVVAIIALDQDTAARTAVKPVCPILVLRSTDLHASAVIGAFVAGLEAVPAPVPTLSPVLVNDPEVVGRLREAGPVHKVDGLADTSVWMLTGHRCTTAVLDDPGLAGGPELVPRFRRPQGRLAALHRGEKDLITIEAEEHRRLRQIVSHHLTERLVDLLRPRMRREAEQLLDRLPTQDRVDFVGSFARPFPVAVLCDVVGVPEPDRAYIEDWLLRRVPTEPDDPHEDVDRYLLRLVETRRCRPGENFIDAVLRADGPTADARDVVAAVRFLLLSGLRAPTTMLASGVAALLAERSHWERAVADPSSLGTVVEELLRFVTPFPLGTMRRAHAPVTVGDALIQQGCPVAASLVAANRDPEVFNDPDVLDPWREHNPHLAFGGGHHGCLGSHLARTQLAVALEALLRRHPRMVLADGPASLRYRSSSVRYLLDLPVVLDPVAPGSRSRHSYELPGKP